MTKFMSRTDVFYGLAAVTAVAAVLAGQILGFVVANFLIPPPTLPTGGSFAAQIEQTRQVFEHYNMLLNAINTACIVIVFCAAFLGLAAGIKRLGAKLSTAGIWFGAIFAAAGMAALSLATLNASSFAFTNLSPNASVWFDVFSALAIAGINLAALFLAFRYTKFRSHKGKVK